MWASTTRTRCPRCPPRSSFPPAAGEPSPWEQAIYAFLVEKGSRSGSRRTVESYSQAGLPTTDVVNSMARHASFAVLIHTAEDEQADGAMRARENVVHETGLFQGRLGPSRSIVVRQDGCEAFSNLDGLQEIRYEHSIREVFGDVVATIRREFPDFKARPDGYRVLRP